MSTSCLGKRLVACLLNVSEARKKDLVEAVARAALYNAAGKYMVILHKWTDSEFKPRSYYQYVHKFTFDLHMK